MFCLMLFSNQGCDGPEPPGAGQEQECVWDEPGQQPAPVQGVFRYHGETRQQPQKEARAPG